MSKPAGSGYQTVGERLAAGLVHASEDCYWCQGGDHVPSPMDGYPDAHVYVPSVDWAMFTKRTDDPKLRWLEMQLAAAGIPRRRRGRSFHAPILEVREGGLRKANDILAPVDDIADDDARFGVGRGDGR